MKQWTIRLYERKRKPDLNSAPKRVGNKMVPSDTIPKRLKDLKLKASTKDKARSETMAQLKKLGRDIASINFSADTPGTIIAHVFENKGKMRKVGT